MATLPVATVGLGAGLEQSACVDGVALRCHNSKSSMASGAGMSTDKVRSRQHSSWVATIAAVVAAAAAAATFLLTYCAPRPDACASLTEATILADLQTDTHSWAGWQTTGSPSAEDDSASPTGRTVSASFIREKREASLNVRRDIDLSPYRCLTADVRAAATSGGASNVTAKLYIKVGSGRDQESWHDDGPAAVGSTGQLLRLNLTQIRSRAKTREIGVVFASMDSSPEPVMIYIDRMEAYR